MTGSRTRLSMSAIVCLVWILVTVVGGTLVTGPGRPLSDLVTHGVAIHLVFAVLLLSAAVILFGWRDVGLQAFPAPGSLRILWLPILYLAGFASIALGLGLPAPRLMVFVLINTMLVGISEELMFRGILFQALRSRLSIWPSIWVTTLLFGTVHVLNVFQTGELTAAAIQAVAATITGFLFIAIRIRTASLYPVIVIHAAWDFCLFIVTQSPSLANAGGPESAGTATYLMPFMLTVPNLLYGFYLLRHVSRPVEPGAIASAEE